MDDTYLDNPAGRLLWNLQAIRDFRPESEDAWDGIAQIFAARSGIVYSYAQTLRSLSELVRLPELVKDEVRKLSDAQPSKLLLQWAPRVEKALWGFVAHEENDVTTIGGIAGIYDAADLTSLEFCAETLLQARAEPAISTKALDNVRQKLSELMQELMKDNELDPDLSYLLLGHVNEMRYACTAYTRAGSQAIRDAYDELTGAMVNNWPLVVQKHSTSTETWKKVVAVLGAIAAVLGSSAEVIKAIESPSSTQPVIQQVITVPAQITPGSPVAPQAGQAAKK